MNERPKIDRTPRTTVFIDPSWWDRDDDRDDGPVDDYDDPEQPR